MMGKKPCILLTKNAARVNVSTMLSLKTDTNPRNVNYFEIGFDLAMSLVLPQVSRRPKTGLNKTQLQKVSIILDEAIEVQNVVNDLPFPKTGELRKNCKKCLHDIAGDDYKSKKAKLPKNKTQCQKCGHPFCPTHLQNICAGHKLIVHIEYLFGNTYTISFNEIII